MQVRVDTIGSHPFATIALAEGVVEGGEHNGQRVMFGGDWRPMKALAEALLSDDEQPVAEVEDWQVLRWIDPKDDDGPLQVPSDSTDTLLE